MIRSELVGWADMCGAWYQYGLDEICDEFHDMAYDCPDLDIYSEEYDAGPLSDTSYWIETDNPEAARKFLRDRTALLLRENMDKIRVNRREVREQIAREKADLELVPVVVDRVFAHYEARRSKNTAGRIPRLSIRPWPDGRKAPLDKGTIALCTWDLGLGVDEIAETILYRRLPKTDQLWVESWAKSGKAISAPHLGSAKEAQLALLSILILSRVGFGWPFRPQGGFTLSTKVLEQLIKEIEGRLGAMREGCEDK
jgi:hypothetical protein